LRPKIEKCPCCGQPICKENLAEKIFLEIEEEGL